MIDPTAARKVGTISDYQVDPVAGRLAALDVTPLDGGTGERIAAQRVRRVGGSAVMLTARGGSMPSGMVEVNERWLDSSTMVGLEVMSEDGVSIGHLVDAVFDPDSLAIEAYLLQGNGVLDSLSGRRNRIEPDKVQSCSRDLMLVSFGVEKAAVESPPAPIEEPAPVEAAQPVESTRPVEKSVPLKKADKLPTSSFETVPNGDPASSSRT